jgi:hypothetical protein
MYARAGRPPRASHRVGRNMKKIMMEDREGCPPFHGQRGRYTFRGRDYD